MIIVVITAFIYYLTGLFSGRAAWSVHNFGSSHLYLTYPKWAAGLQRGYSPAAAIAFVQQRDQHGTQQCQTRGTQGTGLCLPQCHWQGAQGGRVETQRWAGRACYAFRQKWTSLTDMDILNPYSGQITHLIERWKNEYGVHYCDMMPSGDDCATTATWHRTWCSPVRLWRALPWVPAMCHQSDQQPAGLVQARWLHWQRTILG